MELLNVFSMTSTVNDWRVNTRRPRILHIFDHACNLINERREILSIVTPQIGNGPFNLVVDDDILFSKYLKIDTQVYIFEDRLEIDNLVVDLKKAKLWNPRPDWEGLHANKETVLNQVSSLSDAYNEPASYASILSTLTRAVAHADVNISLAVAKQLAGLGIGLTPAGDDIMMGALYAAWIVHSFDVASVLAREIAETASSLTTSLSGAYLEAAGKGEAGVLWHNLFNALLENKIIPLSIAKLLSIGETSGADALAGFFGVMFACKEIIINECPS